MSQATDFVFVHYSDMTSDQRHYAIKNLVRASRLDVLEFIDELISREDKENLPVLDMVRMAVIAKAALPEPGAKEGYLSHFWHPQWLHETTEPIPHFHDHFVLPDAKVSNYALL